MFLESFNHSGLKPLDPVFLHLGEIRIMWYAVLILSGAMIALFLAILEGKKIGVPKDFLEDLVLFGLPISVICARIYYVIFEYNYYVDNPQDIVKIWNGGLAIHGAIIGASIWGYFFCKAKGVSFLKAVDLASIGFLIAQATGRWGNFMNQEAHGGPVPGATLDEQRAFLFHTGLPKFIVNQMYIPNDPDGAFYYYPTFFYESMWNLLGVLLILLLRRTKYLFVGDLGLIYLIWYSIGRYFIEGMRTDSLYFHVFGTAVRTAQFISVVLSVSALILLIFRHYTRWYPKYYYEIIEENKVERIDTTDMETL